jgi:hypothetical protein
MKERIAQLEAVISKGPTVASSTEKVAFQEKSEKGVDPSADDDNPEVGEVGFEASIWDGIIVVGLPMLNPDSGRPLIQPGQHFTICFLWICNIILQVFIQTILYQIIAEDPYNDDVYSAMKFARVEAQESSQYDNFWGMTSMAKICTDEIDHFSWLSDQVQDIKDFNETFFFLPFQKGGMLCGLCQLLWLINSIGELRRIFNLGAGIAMIPTAADTNITINADGNVGFRSMSKLRKAVMFVNLGFRFILFVILLWLGRSISRIRRQSRISFSTHVHSSSYVALTT